MQYKYNYTMGIKVGNQKIPDVYAWNYTVSDLDTEGGRDATGYLHRAYVATKINYEFQWNMLEWEMLQTILTAVNKEKFTLTAPDPRTFNSLYSGEYYVGDRTGKAHYFYGVSGASSSANASAAKNPELATYTLKLKFIQY